MILKFQTVLNVAITLRDNLGLLLFADATLAVAVSNITCSRLCIVPYFSFEVKKAAVSCCILVMAVVILIRQSSELNSFQD